MPILMLPRRCQFSESRVGNKAIQLDRLSSGMQEVVGNVAQVEHIVGKTLGMTASSFAPVPFQRRHNGQAEYSSLDVWQVGGVAHLHMKAQKKPSALQLLTCVE